MRPCPAGRRPPTAAQALFRQRASIVPDVLACDLANVNMVLHAPGAVLGAAWVEATRGDFTFYVQGMTAGVARVMRALDEERRAVARAFGHELPSVIEEMQAIGTVEPSIRDVDDFVAAISSGEANRRIKAPDSLQHRYYREDFGHGLLPFTALAAIAGVDVPVAASLLRIGQSLVGIGFCRRRPHRRTDGHCRARPERPIEAGRRETDVASAIDWKTLTIGMLGGDKREQEIARRAAADRRGCARARVSLARAGHSRREASQRSGRGAQGRKIRAVSHSRHFRERRAVRAGGAGADRAGSRHARRAWRRAPTSSSAGPTRT